MGLPCFPFILLQLFMSLNACSDINWAYLVFLSYFWNYSCPLMHAWILNSLTLFSFHTFGIICLLNAWILNGLTLFSFHILLELFMSLNACSDIQMGLPCIPFIILQLFMPLNACLDIKWAYLVFLSYFCNYSVPGGMLVPFLEYIYKPAIGSCI